MSVRFVLFLITFSLFNCNFYTDYNKNLDCHCIYEKYTCKKTNYIIFPEIKSLHNQYTYAEFNVTKSQIFKCAFNDLEHISQGHLNTYKYCIKQCDFVTHMDDYYNYYKYKKYLCEHKSNAR